MIDNSKRTQCEIYTRVMGYMRPASQFNTGKKSEFYSRQYFDVDLTNASFNGYAESNKIFCENH